MVLIEDIYAKTNNGLDIILFFYPQARECLSGRQKQWQEECEANGNKYIICRSVEEFINEVNNYLN